ncbi:MAG: general secretion pathway protein L [Oceanicoccus sp.]|jgi:general secretion pathway protein L
MKLHLFNAKSQGLQEIEQGGIHVPDSDNSVQTLIINDTFCQVLAAQMPVKQARQIIKALPFALEEQLANEIDNNHIHYIGREGIEAYALVVEHRIMSALVDQFEPDAVQYFPLLLPQIEQGICVCILNNVASIRFSKFGVLSVPPDILSNTLEKLKTDSNDIVEFYDFDDSHTLLPLEIENLGYEVQQPEKKDLLLLIEKASASYSWNLLSGEYTKKKAKVATKHSKIKGPLAIAATLILTVFFIQLIEMKQYQQMTSLVSDASKSFYSALFPGETVRSIRRQFKDKLDEAGAGPTASAGFVSLLASVTKDIKFDSVEWDAVRFTRQKNELEINLIVENIAQLDSIKQKLSGSGLIVDITSATNTGKRIKGVLKVSKNG